MLKFFDFFQTLTFFFGMTGFEPATPCSQSICATKLRYIPFLFLNLVLHHFLDSKKGQKKKFQKKHLLKREKKHFDKIASFFLHFFFTPLLHFSSFFAPRLFLQSKKKCGWTLFLHIKKKGAKKRS